ncbi:MAG TPA: hypothetical protein VNA04_12935 [Thermoanaerobaculia bacterium]|nr:hypothetical protein [Thermoanaerobaculia bacterium]
MHKVIVAAGLLLTLACGKLNPITDPGGSVPPVDPTATFTRVQTEIFARNCTVIGCHDLLGRQQNLILVPGQAYAHTVGVPSEQMPALRRVQPGNFADSYLYRKLTGIGITGERMPFGGPYLNASELALVRDWVRRGAPND